MVLQPIPMADSLSLQPLAAPMRVCLYAIGTPASHAMRTSCRATDLRTADPTVGLPAHVRMCSKRAIGNADVYCIAGFMTSENPTEIGGVTSWDCTRHCTTHCLTQCCTLPDLHCRTYLQDLAPVMGTALSTNALCNCVVLDSLPRGALVPESQPRLSESPNQD